MCYVVQRNEVIFGLEPLYREHEGLDEVLKALIQMISRLPTLKLMLGHGPAEHVQSLCKSNPFRGSVLAIFVVQALKPKER